MLTICIWILLFSGLIGAPDYFLKLISHSLNALRQEISLSKVYKVPMKRSFSFFLMKEHKKTGRLPFTVSQYLIWFLSYKVLKMLKSRQKVWARNM